MPNPQPNAGNRGSDPASSSTRTILKDVYEKPARHVQWESVYRGDPLIDAFNDEIMDRLLLEMDPPAHGLILDAGCGVGDHTLRIAKRGFRCVGADISKFILKQAEQRVSKTTDLAGEATFVCESLEQLSFPDNTFDAIHCRGVLMHIPDCERALQNLCRVLKPGGHIAIMESNCMSPEAIVVSAARLILKGRKRIKLTPAGIEFWKYAPEGDFLIRSANLRYLGERLKQLDVENIRRICTSLISVGSFRAGALRDAVVRLNRKCFAANLPANICHGNAIIGKKFGGIPSKVAV